jgi:hypothetical protein
MKVESSFTIDGNVVEPTELKVGVYSVYRYRGDYDYILYFVDKDLKVISRMEIESDMGQGCGYVSDVTTFQC